ncbi:phosphopantetheine-binding protein [Paenibacillus wynnii]|uniref:phosphopantetheine-binding protein n=1 Tax=Paenibacillus wynnii TaxID=268407 RepID=UPI0027919A98|nr:phosphopantetheine-binding protein [Paenibacillus wynnii]MDQ0193751.1 acyl carrier protein [Paenibacillus wynnii]
MNSEQVTAKILEVIKDKFNNDLNLEENNIQLLEAGLNLDSLQILELVMYLEDELSILIPDDELDPEIFTDIQSLASFLSNKLVLV